jgi:hypothetical protein
VLPEDSLSVREIRLGGIEHVADPTGPRIDLVVGVDVVPDEPAESGVDLPREGVEALHGVEVRQEVQHRPDIPITESRHRYSRRQAA